MNIKKKNSMKLDDLPSFMFDFELPFNLLIICLVDIVLECSTNIGFIYVCPLEDIIVLLLSPHTAFGSRFWMTNILNF
jgi:hypothetical protein